MSKAKTSFDAIFANKSLMSNTKAQEMANTVFNYMERKPEFEVLQTLQMKTNNQDGATGGGGGGSGSGGGASHYNVAARHSVSGASSRYAQCPNLLREGFLFSGDFRFSPANT